MATTKLSWPTARTQQSLILLAVAGAALAVPWRSFMGLQVVKLTAVVVAAVLVSAVVATRAAVSRDVNWPRHPAAWAGLAVVGLMAATTIAAPVRWAGLVGPFGRGTGLLLYLACVTLFLAGLEASSDPDFPRRTALTVLGVGTLVTGYGVLQAFGLDPYPWEEIASEVVTSTLGNPNFAAAYFGITVPLALWGATVRRWPRPLRVACGVLAAGGFVFTLFNLSVQGTVAAAAGIAVVGLALLLERGGTARRAGLPALAGAVVLAGVLGAVGLTGAGPLAPLLDRADLEARTWFWSAGVEMVREHPVAGVGMAGFAAHYPAYRPMAAAESHRDSPTNDPHSVPLAMVVHGGPVLGLAYLGVVGLTGWALLSGLIRLQGPRRLLLGGLGGAWAGYQVQSLVSIDVPALAVLHWVLAAAVVGASTAPAGPPTRHRGRPTGARRGVVAAVAVVTVVAVALATWPLRAELAAAEGRRQADRGQAAGAREAFDRAVALVPREFTYWAQRGEVLEAAGDLEAAYASYLEASRRNPWSPPAAGKSAQLAEQLGETEAARRHYERLLELDSKAATHLLAAGGFHLRLGEVETARELLEEGIARVQAMGLSQNRSRRIGVPGWWTLVGDARLADGDPEAAIEAYEEALSIDPEHEQARQRLAEPTGGP